MRQVSVILEMATCVKLRQFRQQPSHQPFILKTRPFSPHIKIIFMFCRPLHLEYFIWRYFKGTSFISCFPGTCNVLLIYLYLFISCSKNETTLSTVISHLVFQAFWPLMSSKYRVLTFFPSLTNFYKIQTPGYSFIFS